MTMIMGSLHLIKNVLRIHLLIIGSVLNLAARPEREREPFKRDRESTILNCHRDSINTAQTGKVGFTPLPYAVYEPKDATQLPLLRVSKDRHFIVTETGDPFFWLGDTAWDLFRKLSREDAVTYLKNRAEKGFTVIQAWILPPNVKSEIPNVYGEIPLVDKNPACPNEKYFKNIDYILDKAASLDLYMALVPTWGTNISPRNPSEPIVFTERNAFAYGQYVGKRYRDKPIIWIIGGDRNVYNENEMK